MTKRKTPFVQSAIGGAIVGSSLALASAVIFFVAVWDFYLPGLLMVLRTGFVIGVLIGVCFYFSDDNEAPETFLEAFPDDED